MGILATLRPELEATGLPWSTAVGTKHIKLYIGRRLVGVIPLKDKGSTRSKRAVLNVRAQICRAAKG